MPLLPLGPRVLGHLQRVLLVALLAPVLLITVLATVPALAVLPFLRNGNRRTVNLLNTHAATATVLLRGSRPGN
ncbi:dTMP kinase [Kitasatospora sp. P5_F3]